MLTRFQPAALEVVDRVSTTPWVTPGAFTELMCSWAADTPGDAHVEVEAQVRSGANLSRWLCLGRWAAGDEHFCRTSVPGQTDVLATVDVDVLRATERRSRRIASASPARRRAAARARRVLREGAPFGAPHDQ